ncbi:DHA2 family efflux MFS transporter permease subunit [Streptomyces sp. ADMS]|uniref:DHA2 family efflux MFS transporter permease subunit n=1 Tax=Streptomyces sp. ADMS TaxID=3071415 RepID=UPI00296F5BDD|nr:DHA2 family efflux MFS transporter permease subunit [Streptomyces sp. ADMS]MDW4905786.1 DHA2 family efflux MFS transporter permease subunit [Streptomyces sp. ADMS]
MSTDAIWDNPKRWWALGVLVVCVLVNGLDATILYVAMPELVDALGASNSELQWFHNAYLLVFASLMLPFGVLADRIGLKRLLLGGLGVFGLASAYAMAVDSSGELIVGRAVMGLGAAVITPVSLAMLPVLFAPQERARALAIWSAGVALGLPIGPLAGGWLLEHFWWGSVFLINIPIVALAMVAGLFLFPERRGQREHAFDWQGAVLSVIGLGSLTYALTQAPEEGWLSAATLVGAAVGAVFLTLFVLRERATEHPLLDVLAFRNRRFGASVAALLMVHFAMTGFLFMLSPYLQAVLGNSSFGTGVRMLPVVLAVMVGAGSAERLAPRVGPRGPVTAGLLLLGGGLLIFSSTGVDSSDTFVALAQLPLGLGIGLTLAIAMHTALSTAPDEKSGEASGATSAFRQVGGVVGVAVLGSVLGTAYKDDMESATRGLPEPAADAAGETVGAALQVAAQLGSKGEALAETARKVYVDSMDLALVGGGMVLFVLAAVVFAWMPSGAARAHEKPAGPVGKPAELEDERVG